MWTVYMHTCPNGKRYVGITNRRPKTRWARGNGYYKQFFYRAIQKYGWDNIKHEIIARVGTLEEAAKIETDLIHKYRTAEREYGYNISPSTDGAYGTPRSFHSEETKRKQSEAAKARPMSSRNLNGLLLHRGTQKKGCHHNLTPEGKLKSKETKSKPVVRYTADMIPVGVYESASEAQKITGINAYNSLHTGYKSGGHIWKHLASLSMEEINNLLTMDLLFTTQNEAETIIHKFLEGDYLSCPNGKKD